MTEGLCVYVRPGWQEAAACRGLDPELFFPTRGEDYREARKVCAACPVRWECLEAALARSERFGFWGGHSERERRVLRRKRSEGLKPRAGLGPVPTVGAGDSVRPGSRILKGIGIPLAHKIQKVPIGQPPHSPIRQPHMATVGVVGGDDDQATIDEGRDHDTASLGSHADGIRQLEGGQPGPAILKSSQRTLLCPTETCAHHAQV
jgi:WhiB family redox-sensing transcriptional regulator